MVIYSGWYLFFACLIISGIGCKLLVSHFKRKGTSQKTINQFIAAAVFFAGPVIAIALLLNFTSSITEITSTNHKTFTTLGSFDYTASDGQTVHIDLSNEYDDYLVNLTDEVLIKDYISYGLGMNFDNGTRIPPHSSINTYGSPDYYPWQTPPSEIEVVKGLRVGGRTWVHYESVSMRDIFEE